MNNNDFYNTYHEYVLNVMTHEVGRELAEDITQDTFIKAFDAIERNMFDGKNAKAWLSFIAKNTLRDYWRRNNKIKNLAVDDNGRYFDIHDVVDENKEHNDLITESMSEVKDLLSTLSKDQDYAFRRFYLDGVSSKDIGEETGVSINTVLGRLRYARNKLRKQLTTRV